MGTYSISNFNFGQVETDHITKVLLIDNSVTVTGAFRSIRGFIHSLENYVHFYYAVPSGCWTNVKDIPHGRLQRFSFLELRKSLSVLWYLPHLILNTIKASVFIQRHSINIVHVNDLYNMMGIGIKVLHPKIKLIYHVRLLKSGYAGIPFPIWVWFIKKFANAIICVSGAVEKDIAIINKRVHKIYDGLPMRWMANAKQPAEENAVVRFLYVGNYIPGKGQDLALRAIEIAAGKVTNIEFKFIGQHGQNHSSSKYFSELRRFVEDKMLNNIVELAGYSNNILSEMAACDAVLNFSQSESFSMVCLESLACKRGIIASKSGGPEEIIRNGLNGLLVDKNNIEEMAEAIVYLASSEDTRKMFSKNAHIDFETKFNLNVLSKKLLAVYQDIQ